MPFHAQPTQAFPSNRHGQSSQSLCCVQAKRSILEEAHQTIWNQMDRWFTRLAEFAEQIKDPLKRKAYDHSYVTPYQLERLEMVRCCSVPPLALLLTLTHKR